MCTALNLSVHMHLSVSVSSVYTECVYGDYLEGHVGQRKQQVVET